MSTAALLASYLDQADGRGPFDWRTYNCSHFAAGWWQACTGVDALQGIAMPASANEAARLLARRGGTLVDLVTSRIDRPRIDPRLAQPGDLLIINAGAWFEGGIGAALGICTGRLAVMLSAEGRLVRGPMACAVHAFPLDKGRGA
jgi:hypothetical protein